MTSPIPSGGQQGIEVTGKLLDVLKADGLAALIGMGADLVLLVDENGVIIHCHYENSDFDGYGLKEYLGKPLRDCVTIESVPKIDAMLGPDRKRPARGYQVNHSASGKPDLPIAYTAHTQKSLPFSIVVGREMRQQMQDQQRLVEAQIAMEADYRDLRQVEARYRTAFKLSETADIMIDGEKRTVLEANTAAIELLTGGSGNLINKSVRDLFARQDRDPLIDAIAEARHSGRPVRIAEIKTAKGDSVSASLRAYRENGATNLLLILRPTDVQTSQEHQLNAGGATSAHSNLELVPEPVAQTDTDGTITAANAMFLDLVQAPTLNQVVGRHAGNWLGNTSVDLSILLSRVTEEKVVRAYSTVLRDTLGGEHPLSVSAQFDTRSQTIQMLLIPRVGAAEKVSIQSTTTPEQAEGFASLVGKVPLKELIRESLDVVEKICIEAALDQTNNNRASAAEILGLSRQSLYIKLRRHGLESYRPGS